MVNVRLLLENILQPVLPGSGCRAHAWAGQVVCAIAGIWLLLWRDVFTQGLFHAGVWKIPVV
jgi:hypothetical protein